MKFEQDEARTEELAGATSKTALATKAWITPPAWIAVVRREKPCSLSSRARKVSLQMSQISVRCLPRDADIREQGGEHPVNLLLGV